MYASINVHHSTKLKTMVMLPGLPIHSQYFHTTVSSFLECSNISLLKMLIYNTQLREFGQTYFETHEEKLKVLRVEGKILQQIKETIQSHCVCNSHIQILRLELSKVTPYHRRRTKLNVRDDRWRLHVHVHINYKERFLFKHPLGQNHQPEISNFTCMFPCFILSVTLQNCKGRYLKGYVNPQTKVYLILCKKWC